MNQSFPSKLRRFIFGLSTTEEREVYQMVRKAEIEVGKKLQTMIYKGSPEVDCNCFSRLEKRETI